MYGASSGAEFPTQAWENTAPLTGGTVSGVADVGFLLSKELLRESDWVPNLVGSAGWTSPTRFGGTYGPIPYVSGFQAGVTASKRLDPLVTFVSLSYFSSASRDIAGTTVNPSNIIASRVGASLAISPFTSITAGASFAYFTNVHPEDLAVPNSDRLLSTVDLGLSTIVWARTLFNITGQFGITGHVPNLRIITSLPVRF
jgi:hypothetical protein